VSPICCTSQAVKSERGQASLRVARADGGEINRARPFRAVGTPDGLRHVGSHVHRFRTVAPARRDGALERVNQELKLCDLLPRKCLKHINRNAALDHSQLNPILPMWKPALLVEHM